MNKQTAQAVGIGGAVVAGLALLDSNVKANTIAGLQAQVAEREEALRRKNARVAMLESERGELLRARDVANGKLEQANQRIDTLNAKLASLEGKGQRLQEQVDAKGAEIAQLREQLEAARGARKA